MEDNCTFEEFEGTGARCSMVLTALLEQNHDKVELPYSVNNSSNITVELNSSGFEFGSAV
jgi:hypothetical protein